MRFLLLACTVVAGAFGIGRAEAQNYPWCAYYRSGATNCGFSTQDQCQQALSGIGGSCMQNTQYHGPAPRAPAAAAAPSHRDKPKPKEKLVAPQPQ